MDVSSFSLSRSLVDDSRIVDRYFSLFLSVDMSLSLSSLSLSLSSRQAGRQQREEKEKCNRSKLSKASSAYINERRRRRRQERKEKNSSSSSSSSSSLPTPVAHRIVVVRAGDVYSSSCAFTCYSKVKRREEKESRKTGTTRQLTDFLSQQ